MEGYKVKGLFVCLFVRVHLAYNKNPNCQEAIRWLFNKRGRGFKLGTTENKSSKWPERERESNTRPPDCESNALTTRSRSLLK